MTLDAEPLGQNRPAPNASGESDEEANKSAPSIPPTPPAKTHCEVTCKTEKDFWDHVKTGAEIIGIVLLAVYTGYTIKMYCANKQSADAATRAATSAENSVTQARDNARLEQRAWVSVSDITPESQQGQNWTISIIFKNTGRTPAKNFVIRGIGEPVAKGKKTSSEEIILPGHGIIAPDGVFHSNFSADGGFDWKSVDLVIHGKIEYDTVFGSSHWTTFCYYFVPTSKTGKGGFAPCDSGNDIDNNPP